MTDRSLDKKRPTLDSHQGGRRSRLGAIMGSTATSSVIVILAFLLGFFILGITGFNPIQAFSAMFRGALGSKRGIAETLLSMTPLILSGLGFALAYHCKLFNIGLEGQIAVGAIAASWLGYSIEGLPCVVHVTICLVGACLAGAVWGFFPGFLKARYNIHEVISVIMLNHIAFKVAAYMVSVGGPMKDPTDLMPASPYILTTAKLPRIWAGTRFNVSIFIALAMAFVVWVFLYKSRPGYMMRAVGSNPDAAQTVGISATSFTILAMVLSSALGGLAGGIEILGIHHRLLAQFSPGYGFDAIAVALLGQLNPIAVVASSFLYGVLRSGAVLMQVTTGVSKDMVSVLTATIIFFTSMKEPFARWMKHLFSAIKGHPMIGRSDSHVA
ncbi:MAG: ABC transporter permease [Sphaerochaeta sp.]|nr:ABC transporter permease [Sphaerochaeta sp.]